MSDTVNLNNLTEYSETDEELDQKVTALASLIQTSSKTVFFTGAGISTSGGIADYRGPNGVWTRQAQKKSAPKSKAFSEATPTLTHMAIQTLLTEESPVDFLISQNVDGLHRRSGVPREMIAELHGNSFKEICWACGKDWMRREEVRGRQCAPKSCRECLARVPHFCHCTGNSCTSCGSKTKDSIIHFEENLPQKELADGFEHSEGADLHIVLGSSLRVRPACMMPIATADKGGNLVIVNLQKTPYDSRCAIRIFAKTDVVMALLMEKIEMSIHIYEDSLEDDADLPKSFQMGALNPTIDIGIDYNEIISATDVLPGGGYQVTPIRDCPHVRDCVQPKLLPATENVADLLETPCSLCNEPRENMICASCMTICCGRHANSHMINHFEKTDHCIVIGVQDLSFWCYKCEAYLDPAYSPEVAYIYNELHIAKFQEPAPGLETIVQEFSQSIQQELPRHISGLWTSNLESKDTWTLSIVPKDRAPNVFGSFLMRGESISQFIIHGMVDNITHNVTFNGKNENGDICEFKGNIKMESKVWTLRGSWKLNDSKRSLLLKKKN